VQPLSISFWSPWTPGLLSLVIYTGLVLALMAVLLLLTGWLGEEKGSLEKARPYECGIIPSGSARLPYPVPFYLVAAFFLIFDVETAFIFSWAIAFDHLGFLGWLQVTFFIFILLLSLAYLWLKGGLDWGPTSSTGRSIPKTSS
jgi:NADH-quinone oxidoreductase subunit A